MAESNGLETTPGPNQSDSERAVRRVLEETTDPPVLTVGMVEDRVDFSRRTVHSRLKELADSDPKIKSHQIGSATGYWYSRDEMHSGLNSFITPFSRGWAFYHSWAVSKLTGDDETEVLEWELTEYAGNLPLLITLLAAWFVGYALLNSVLQSVGIVLGISAIWYGLLRFSAE